MNETCRYAKNGQFIGNPTSNRAYGYCDGGVLVGTGLCANNGFYNMRTGKCQSDVPTYSTNVANECSQYGVLTYVRDPESCSRFCYCSKTVGPSNETCNYCPIDQWYDSENIQCVWKNTIACSAESICNLLPDGTFVGAPEECGSYYYCLKGTSQKPTPTKCDNNLYFDSSKASCVTNNPCGTAPNPPSQPSPTTPDIPDAVKNCPKIGFFDDAKTCVGYFSCLTIGGKPIYGICPTGTHFDPAKQKCVTPFSYKCPADRDRCGNLNLDYVTVVGTSCRTFKSCTSTSTTFKCADIYPNYPFFDEQSQKCVSTAPEKQLICSP